jgi:hypothetical protein
LEVCSWDNNKIHDYNEKENERLKKREKRAEIEELEKDQIPFYISVEEIFED